MPDPVIDEMALDILNYRKFAPTSHTLVRWASHLRDVVQPQLEELEALRATKAAKAPKAVAQ